MVSINAFAFFIAIVVSQIVGKEGRAGGIAGAVWLSLGASSSSFVSSGMLWYSPLLFEKQYLAALGRPADYFSAGMKADPIKTLYLPWSIGITVSALALYVIIHFLHFIKAGLTREGATSIVFWGWLGFSALPSYSSHTWNHSPLALFLITQGARFLSALVAALTYVELSQGKAKAAPASADKPATPRGTPRGRSRSPRSKKL